MTPLKLYPLRARVLIAAISLVFLAFTGGTFADSPPTRVSIRPAGTSDFTLEWNAVPDASYKIQGGNFGDTPGLNGGDMIWKTIDLVTPSNNVGSKIGGYMACIRFCTPIIRSASDSQEGCFIV